MTASGVSLRRNVSPGWPGCPPVFLPERSRRLLTRGGFFNPSLDGGLPLLLLFSPRRRSNSAMRASCANSRAMSASFDSWLSAVRSTDSLESARRSRVNHHLQSVPPKGTWAVTSNQKIRQRDDRCTGLRTIQTDGRFLPNTWGTSCIPCSTPYSPTASRNWCSSGSRPRHRPEPHTPSTCYASQVLISD